MVNLSCVFYYNKRKIWRGECTICSSTEFSYSFLIPHGGFFTSKLSWYEKKTGISQRDKQRRHNNQQDPINFKEYKNACKVFCFVLFYPAFLVMIGEAEYKQSEAKSFQKAQLIIG